MPSEIELCCEALDFLEEAYQQWGEYSQGDPRYESVADALNLNYVKTVNDCRAILLLAQAGFYIQAGILARSTEDACSMMMHIAFEAEDAALVEKWLAGQRVTHWMLVERINQSLVEGAKLEIRSYREIRRRLDHFVHANYPALKLYPAQSPGPTPLDERSFRKMTFWKHLVFLYLFSCLLVVALVVPELGQRAEVLRRRLESMSSSLPTAA